MSEETLFVCCVLRFYCVLIYLTVEYYRINQCTSNGCVIRNFIDYIKAQSLSCHVSDIEIITEIVKIRFWLCQLYIWRFFQHLFVSNNIEKLHISYINSRIWLNLLIVFDLLVPRVTPARVSGGGGGRSELVITWEVSIQINTKYYLCFLWF